MADSSPSTSRPTSPGVRPPGPVGTVRRRAAAKNDSNKVNSMRAAGAGGSTTTMMKLYSNDDTPGLPVDPVIVIVLAIVFIGSVVALHLMHKFIRMLTK